MSNSKKKLATFWLDGCSGCHMSFLDMDERLIEILDYYTIVHSPLVDSKTITEQIDVTLVEGAVSTEEDLHKLHEIRKATKILVALGDCAVTGNVPSLRNTIDTDKLIKNTYSIKLGFEDEIGIPRLLKKTRPLNQVVDVDIFLPGCPPPSSAIYETLCSVVKNTSIKVTNLTRFGR